ncbi:beta-lactamase family protein [bacterium]|nr:beta-lactamase family protein [bacterium]MCI0606546.1 beta-lactamase family protein [bacterium]
MRLGFNGRTLLILISTISICFGDSVTIHSSLGTKLDQYLERLEGFGFSGQMLIAKDEEIILHKGYGLADREKGIAVTTGMLFEIASISKQFTAAAILKLEMLGKLTTSDSVRRFFPSAPEVWQDVTLHRLLTHTAGLEDDYVYYSRHPLLERDPYIEHILQSQLSKDREMVYSNDGYVLLAAIVEKASGRSFEEFVSQELFLPAGMEESGFKTKPEKILSSLAIGYGGTRTIPGPNWLNIGNTGIVSNVEDLYRWHMALQSDRVLSKKSREKFFSAYVKTDLPFDYGYGWWIEKDPRFGKVVWHSGNSNSFSGVYRWYVDRRMLVILLTNLAIADFPAREALFPAVGNTHFKCILNEEPFELPPPFLPVTDGPLNRFNGIYRFQDGSQVEITTQNESLTVLPHGQQAFDHFLPPGYPQLEKDRKTLAEFTKKTESLLQSLSLENPRILEELTGDQTAFPGGDALDVFWEKWKDLQNQYGPLTEFEVLGTAIVYRTEKSLLAETISLQTYEKGKAYYRWVWNHEHLTTALPGLPLPVIPPFRNQSGNSFVNLHLLLHASTFLEFDIRQGEPVAFRVNGERAEKIKARECIKR